MRSRSTAGGVLLRGVGLIAFGSLVAVACVAADDQPQATAQDLQLRRFDEHRAKGKAKVAEAYVRLTVPGRAARDSLGRIVSIDRVSADQVWAYASPAQLKHLEAKGFAYQRLPHPGANPGVRMGLFERSGKLSWSAYPTYAEYVRALQQWAAAHPQRARLVNLGPSTNRQRPHALWAMKISDNPDLDEDEPEVLLTATMHGDETVGYVLLLRLIEELLTRYGSDREVRGLVDNLEIWINPLANPDGTYFSSDSSVDGAIRAFTDAQGGESWVDPNRNFPDPLAGDHPDGLAWASETQAMMAFATQRSFALSGNFHGGAELVNYPWDDRASRHADDAWFIHLSRAYADLAQADGPAGYMEEENRGITNGYDWYFADGTRQDYMTYFHGGREVTVELSQIKNPAASDLNRYWQSNRRALLGFLGGALKGVRGRVTDPQGTPLHATITALNHDRPEDRSTVETDPAVGDFHRLLLPGSYDLRFTSEGYLPRDIASVAVTSGAATRVDVTLDPAPRLDLRGQVTDSHGLPIPDALVELVGSSRAAQVTRRNGSYLFRDLPEGQYAVRVSRQGFATFEKLRGVTQASPRQDVLLARLQVVAQADLESGSGGFIASGSPSPGWRWGVADAGVGAHSGTRVWGAALSEDYSDNADWNLELGPVALPGGAAAGLTFWHRFETESGYDGGRVLASIDGGAFQLLQPEGGYPQAQVDALGGSGYAGSSGGWKQARFDLSAYAGRWVALRFHFASDSAQTAAGWHLDDLMIESHKVP
ncbi:MAG: carboxypeptidase regulatory-like domain-containing protein [Deltaproteobacteria bacterium]|nr:carboxypeptidase regulatory-like domain-containing protein [Deltaproteobacteria bacterium]